MNKFKTGDKVIVITGKDKGRTGEIIKIDGLRVEYGNGWGLLRASNTSPYLVMRFEADTKQCLNEIRKKFIDEILKIDSTLEIPNG